MDRISRIVSALTQPIEDRPRPTPKARASWAGLKPGDRLSHQGVEWTVERCDSDGAVLRHAAGVAHRLESREWKEEGWTKLRRRR